MLELSASDMLSSGGRGCRKAEGTAEGDENKRTENDRNSHVCAAVAGYHRGISGLARAEKRMLLFHGPYERAIRR